MPGEGNSPHLDQPTTVTIELPGIVMVKEPPATEIELRTAWFSVEDVR